MNTHLTGPGDHLIPLSQAEEMNGRYRANKDAILAKEIDPDTLPICETFSRDDFDTLFAQSGCVGIRLYFSMNDDRKVCIVAVGVNESDEDMVDPESSNNIILDSGERCPVNCPPSSPLN